MKFFSQIFDSVQGIQYLSVISLLLFLIVFVMVLVRVYYLKKDVVEEMENLPLDNKLNDVS
jgi:hypothetical protein